MEQCGGAIDVILVGLGLLVVGFFVYVVLFAEWTRQRHKRPLTAEMLYLYLFLYAGAALIIWGMLPLLEPPALDNALSLPPAVLQGMNLVRLFCGVSYIIGLAASFIVLLRHRASATSR